MPFIWYRFHSFYGLIVGMTFFFSYSSFCFYDLLLFFSLNNNIIFRNEQRRKKQRNLWLIIMQLIQCQSSFFFFAYSMKSLFMCADLPQTYMISFVLFSFSVILFFTISIFFWFLVFLFHSFCMTEFGLFLNMHPYNVWCVSPESKTQINPKTNCSLERKRPKENTKRNSWDASYIRLSCEWWLP